MVAAAPSWFADNLREISAVTLLVVTVLVIRLVQKAVMRTVLLVLIAVVALVVYVNRAPLNACVRTCECEIAGRHVTVPACEPDLSF
ncbi:MAG: hypothetical protein ACOYXM_01120 [Actinomycetota bacterium]